MDCMQFVGVCVYGGGLYAVCGVCVCGGGLYTVSGLSVSVVVDCMQLVGVCVCGELFVVSGGFFVGGLYAVCGCMCLWWCRDIPRKYFHVLK